MPYHTHTIFGIDMPTQCPNVPDEVMSPRQSWGDDDAFYAQSNKLAQAFIKNFKKYEEGTSEAVKGAAPKVANKVS